MLRQSPAIAISADLNSTAPPTVSVSEIRFLLMMSRA